MKITETGIEGLLILDPEVYKDQRGYFFESYREELFYGNLERSRFIQDNQSKSTYGVIRGLHYQKGEFAQAKLVRVINGRIFDVAVDLRRESETFGKWYGLELSAENFRQFLVPRGFAHGFSVLSETAVVLYKCDNYYKKEAEAGIRYNDPDLNINWQITEGNELISDKDANLPYFKDF